MMLNVVDDDGDEEREKEKKKKKKTVGCLKYHKGSVVVAP